MRRIPNAPNTQHKLTRVHNNIANSPKRFSYTILVKKKKKDTPERLINMSRNTEVKAVHGNIVVKLDSIDNLKDSVLINN